MNLQSFFIFTLFAFCFAAKADLAQDQEKILNNRAVQGYFSDAAGIVVDPKGEYDFKETPVEGKDDQILITLNVTELMNAQIDGVHKFHICIAAFVMNSDFTEVIPHTQENEGYTLNVKCK